MTTFNVILKIEILLNPITALDSHTLLYVWEAPELLEKAEKNSFHPPNRTIKRIEGRRYPGNDDSIFKTTITLPSRTDTQDIS